MEKSTVFAKLIEEHGSVEREEEDEVEHPDKKRQMTKGEEHESAGHDGLAKKGAALMQTEERNIGAVTWDVYKGYLRFAGGLIWAPIVIGLLALTQGAQGTLSGFFKYH